MSDNQKHFNSGRSIFFLMVFICIIIAASVLKIASTVILPFTIAVLLAFVMFPLILAMDKIKFPRTLSILLVVIIVVSGLYLFGMVLFTSGKMIVDQYPQYEYRFTMIYNYAAELFELPNNEELSFLQNLWDQEAIRIWARDFAFQISNTSVKFLSSAVLVVLFMVFILLEANFFKSKLKAAFGNRITRIDNVGNELISQVTRYLGAKFLISLANGIIFAVAFHFIGLEFALVWGVIQFLMNFIPTLGSIVTGVVISLFALIQFWPEPGPIILVVVVILIVNLVLCNIFDPKIIGEHVGISPLVILISLSIWGFLWGIAGMFLAVPMTVIIKIICENVPILEPVSIFIGSKRSVLAKMSGTTGSAEVEVNESQP